MATPTLDRTTILQVVRTWSSDEQRMLAREILGHIGVAGVAPAEEPLDPPSSRDLAGILAKGQIPPTDEEVARWLDERRVERYG